MDLEETIFIERKLFKRFEKQYIEYEGISDNLKLKYSFITNNLDGLDYVLFNRAYYNVNLNKIIRDFTLLGFDIKREEEVIELSIDYKDLDVIYKIEEILTKNVLKKTLK